MTTTVIVVIDERADLGFESARQKLVLEQDAVPQRLVPALDIALGLRMTRRITGVLHPFAGEPSCQFAGDLTCCRSLDIEPLPAESGFKVMQELHEALYALYPVKYEKEAA